MAGLKPEEWHNYYLYTYNARDLEGHILWLACNPRIHKGNINLMAGLKPKEWHNYFLYLMAGLKPKEWHNYYLYLMPRSSSQHTNEACSQPIPESQSIPESHLILDSTPENPFAKLEVGNDEMYNLNLFGNPEDQFAEFKVGNNEMHNLNLPGNPEDSFVDVEVGNNEVHNLNKPGNPENSSLERHALPTPCVIDSTISVGEIANGGVT
nr:hypothetical protein Iba_chr04cCG13680 [Ipomoea batatas]